MKIAKMNKKSLVMLVLLGVLLIGVVLINGCIPEDVVPVEEPETQIENVSPKEAYDLIQENKGNPDFVILDVRTSEEFASEHIENAINLDYYSETFRDDLDKLDEDKAYVIYCKSGGRSGSTLNTMEELGFTEVYNIVGGITSWKIEELPIILKEEPEPPTPIIENINPEEAYDLIQENKDNPDFMILDVRTPGEFASEHIENAINLNYYSETFRDDLDKLDRGKTYVIYCRSGGRSGNALNIMEELGFMEVYNIVGGISSWKAKGLPVSSE